MGRTWKDFAACCDVDTNWLYDYRNESAAARMCAQCPVDTQCYSYAIAEEIEFGIWGGYRFDIKGPPVKLDATVRRERIALKKTT